MSPQTAKRALSALLSLCIFMSAAACKSAPDPTAQGGTQASGEASAPSELLTERYQKSVLEYFDTVSQLIGYDVSEETFDENAAAFIQLIEDYHKLTDIYHSYEGINNVRTINKNAGIEPVAVDERLIDLLEFSKQMYSETDGLCNIAMGSVLSIWHKYREQGIDDPENAQLPPMEDLRTAAQHCDINDIIIDREAGTVFLADPEMLLDLGAVAKGYTVERAAELLSERGVKSGYTINIGGNVRTIGKKGDGTDWAAGIQNPDTGSDAPYIIRITATDKAVVTSGNYQRFYYVDGVRYHHIIHPETLMPANYFDAVSVVSSDSGRADALSTALYNMPVDEGRALVEALDNTEAIWVHSDGSYEYSDGFAEYILD